MYQQKGPVTIDTHAYFAITLAYKPRRTIPPFLLYVCTSEVQRWAVSLCTGIFRHQRWCVSSAHHKPSFLTACLEWSSGDRGQSVNWDVVTTDQIIFHEQVLVVQQALSEKNSQALDVTTYWGMQQVRIRVDCAL